MAHRRFISAVGSGLLVLLLSAPALAAGPKAYVTLTERNELAVIDTASYSIEPGTVTVGKEPTGVAVTPSRVYVTNAGDDTVTVLDAANNSVVTTIGVGVRPWGIAVDAARNRLYVANKTSGTVTVIDTTDNSEIVELPVGPEPSGVAVNPEGTMVFVTNPTWDLVDVIDTASLSLLDPVQVPGVKEGVAVSPDGKQLLVATQTSVAGAQLASLDLETGIVSTIGIRRSPVGVAVDPRGGRAYVGHVEGRVSVIDITGAHPVFVGEISGAGIGVYGLTVNPSAPQELWAIAQGSSRVTVLDTETHTPLKTFDFEDAGPISLGIFIAAPAPSAPPAPPATVCDDGLQAVVEAAVANVEGAMRAFQASFSLKAATPGARLNEIAKGAAKLNRGHLMGVYQNLHGPQPSWVVDSEFCDEEMKQQVEQALDTLRTALRGIDRTFELPGDGLVSRLQNAADAIARLERGRLQGLYWNLR